MLREFGYGVPDIERAILSARNDATLVAQAEIQPFAIGADGRTGVFNEMHFYDLPWPKAALEKLENEIVTMKVTLSYFIEPNLAGKAATRPDTYRSFGLRFDMKKRTETAARFRSRISASQAKDGTEADGEASCWLLGQKLSRRGRCIAICGAAGRSNWQVTTPSRSIRSGDGGSRTSARSGWLIRRGTLWSFPSLRPAKMSISTVRSARLLRTKR
jgi:hypothetical protein